jgi:hypothetical protein
MFLQEKNTQIHFSHLVHFEQTELYSTSMLYMEEYIWILICKHIKFDTQTCLVSGVSGLTMKVLCVLNN